jgi:Sec-independent protein secretion pathway component TatC
MNSSLLPQISKDASIFIFIQEMKWRAFYLLLSILITFGTCYYISPDLLFWITKPCHEFQSHFIFLNLPEALYTTLTVCGLITWCTCLPLFWYHCWCFLVPGFTLIERTRISQVSLIFFISYGISIWGTFKYFTPYLTKFLLQFQIQQTSFIVEYQATLSAYISWIWSCLIIAFLVCQWPTLLFIGLAWKKLSINFLTQYRKVTFLSCMFIAASLSPPELIIQLGTTLFLWLYTEIILWCFHIYLTFEKK